MNFRDWWLTCPHGKRGKLAKSVATACGVSPATVRLWAMRRRAIKPVYWPTLGQLSSGKVLRADLQAEAKMVGAPASHRLYGARLAA